MRFVLNCIFSAGEGNGRQRSNCVSGVSSAAPARLSLESLSADDLISLRIAEVYLKGMRVSTSSAASASASSASRRGLYYSHVTGDGAFGDHDHSGQYRGTTPSAASSTSE